jgi:hypothetical protein
MPVMNHSLISLLAAKLSHLKNIWCVCIRQEFWLNKELIFSCTISWSQKSVLCACGMLASKFCIFKGPVCCFERIVIQAACTLYVFILIREGKFSNPEDFFYYERLRNERLPLVIPTSFTSFHFISVWTFPIGQCMYCILLQVCNRIGRPVTLNQAMNYCRTIWLLFQLK